MEKKEWFEEWFDSPYYDILYQHRDEKEAEVFINNLVKELSLKSSNKILDLACGKGRHAISLNKLGFDVMGVDLAPGKIEFAKQFENDKLKFQIGDMRQVVKENHFTHVFNLFTSFGYFSNVNDNQKVIESIYESLKPGGVFVLDFLNTEKIKIENSKPTLLKFGEIQFEISKKIESNQIVKTIIVTNKSKFYSFQERVTAFSQEDIQNLIHKSPFRLENIFGDYELNAFNRETSDRVIIKANKKGE